MKTIETDCLVIGTGIAGCTTALSLTNAGHKVLLITRAQDPHESSTAYAQGGIVYRGKGDSAEKLRDDILNAGAGICNPKAVEILSHEGPKLVESILLGELDLQFDQSKVGSADFTNEGAHSVPRILHIGDHTGREIEKKFLQSLNKKENVTIEANSTAVDLLTLAHHSKRPEDLYESPRCLGAYVYDRATSEVYAILAKETVLATGGVGQLYLHSSNPPGARGDGLAMAYRTGARVMNLEYIQFHPTALYSETQDRFLISESLRGEGAVLKNHRGEAFMERYDERGSLAPRDIVSRAIAQEMLREDVNYLFLDITHKPGGWIKERYPTIYAACTKEGIDITTEPIPVVPAAHYVCGGVAVDLEGNTSIRNLKAVGEVSCTGVHGANRLASTSLLEGLVWGVRAGKDLSIKLESDSYSFPEITEWTSQHEAVDAGLLVQDWLTIKHTMWNYVGLIRTRRRLERAQRILGALADEVEKFYAHSKLNEDLIGLRHASKAAQLILTAAQRNHRSIGSHYLEE